MNTLNTIPEGYRINAQGHLVPESQIKPLDKLRDEMVLGIVIFKPAGQGSTATLKVQTYAARSQNILNAWEKFAQGKHQDVCR